jgi:hypothetical protein
VQATLQHRKARPAGPSSKPATCRRCRRADNQKNGLWWVLPGLLCGMSRPGLLQHAATHFRYLPFLHEFAARRTLTGRRCLRWHDLCLHGAEGNSDLYGAMNRRMIFSSAKSICILTQGSAGEGRPGPNRLE